MKKQQLSTRYLAVAAMFTALSFVMVLVSKVIPNVAGFLSYEPKTPSSSSPASFSDP